MIFRRVTLVGMFLVAACWILFPDSPVLPADPCQQDIQKFCAGQKFRHGKIEDCLREHADEVSRECRGRVAAMRDQAQDPMQACAADVKKFCPNVPPGQGRVMHCLKEHESELSAACRAESAELRDRMRRDSPCYADQEKFCADVVPGEGRIRDCLYAHRAELSSRCKPVVENAKEREKEIGSFIDACRGDLQEFCKGVAPGGGRFVQCLRLHESEISDTCKAAIGPGRKQSQKSRRPPAETSQTQSQD